jgi:hypothetical protein
MPSSGQRCARICFSRPVQANIAKTYAPLLESGAWEVIRTVQEVETKRCGWNVEYELELNVDDAAVLKSCRLRGFGLGSPRWLALRQRAEEHSGEANLPKDSPLYSIRLGTCTLAAPIPSDPFPGPPHESISRALKLCAQTIRLASQ